MPQPLTRMMENIREQDPASGFVSRRNGRETPREAFNTNTTQVLRNPLSATSPKVHHALATCSLTITYSTHVALTRMSHLPTILDYAWPQEHLLSCTLLIPALTLHSRVWVMFMSHPVCIFPSLNWTSLIVLANVSGQHLYSRSKWYPNPLCALLTQLCDAGVTGLSEHRWCCLL